MAIAAMLAIGGAANFVAQAQAAKLPTAEVKIDNFSFGPVLLTVAPGTKVTWTNRDDIPHTVVADDKTFKSTGARHRRDVLVHVRQGRTYPYFCSIHPHMTGQVVVK
jgi:plastocyanin